MSQYDSTHTLPAPEPHKALPAPDEHKPGGGVIRKIIVILVILGAAGFAGWRIYKNKASGDAAAPGAGRRGAGGGQVVPVATVPVQQRTVPIYLSALGNVTAYNTVTIKSRVDGQLMRVLVNEGQAVNQGQLLMEIDRQPYEAALAQAEGNLARDQANAANARTEATRYTQLYAAGVVSREQAQTQESTAGQAEGNIKADLAAIQAAKVNLAYTRITSPINGVVGLRQVDPGNIVTAASATGLIVVTQLHPIAIIFTLPEDQLPQVMQKIRKGIKLDVEAYDRSNSNLIAKGQLLTLDNQIDTTTGTAKLKAVFQNTDNSLFPNQFVNVRLVLEQRENSITIPAAAVQSGNTGSFVYVVKDGNPPANIVDADGNAPVQPRRSRGGNGAAGASGAQGASGATGQAGADPTQPRTPPHYVEARPIKVDLTEGSMVIVASGLKSGELVVVDGAEKLRAGSRVAPRASTPTGGRRPVTGASGSTGVSGSTGSTGQTAPDSQSPSGNAQQSANPNAPAHQGGHRRPQQ